MLSAFATTLFSMVAFSASAVYMINGLAALLVIAVALPALAWVERSPLLTGIGVLFAAFSLHTNLSGLSVSVVGFAVPLQVRVLVDVAMPAAVPILGGVIALVEPRRAAR
ncbi:hypothetical protein [Kibdelosporangium phytohabitans]|uniref:Uncharacterized protein n=1 Tax=Kibdelosporangium phytohabitans TaxID=860235 RepID=A0A0N7F514_9PSEU|nr:hypothetical protein [Kibdelosporangium phytohabitans]ALG12959.1 hypothetical protein AOZ06_44335 [Kibdelosporangium phytohabitans]MBE1464672.1 hypothetical protein [Kibdelosporangium phytohabitans]